MTSLAQTDNLQSTPGILLDTNSLIRLLGKPEQIGPKAHQSILQAPVIYTSIISLWEIQIKYMQGKLPVNASQVHQEALSSGLITLNLKVQHLNTLLNLNFSHKDPFDRLLVAQAHAQDLTLLTSDRELLSNFVFAQSSSR